MHPTLFDQEPDLINDFFSLASTILLEGKKIFYTSQLDPLINIMMLG
jgi:hypothetical protein